MVSASNFISPDKNSLISSVNAFLPKIAVLPLCEDENAAEILVREGDCVKEGEVIARAKNLFVHASVPGVVRKIAQLQYSNGKQGLCAVVALEGSFSYLGKKLPRQEWKSYDKSTIGYLLREAGVVNTFSKSVPLFSQLKKARPDYGNLLVLRLFDEDPSLVTESFVSKKFLPSVLEGAAILAKAFGAKACVVAYSENENLKPEIEKFRDLFAPDSELFSVGIDTRKYPSGSMHDIVSVIKKTYKIDIFSKLGKKDLFVDSVTALHTFDAIVYGIPQLSNFVHVTGDCLNSAAILNIRLGTRLCDIVEQCGGFKRKLAKIVVNGVISGKAVGNLEIPVGSWVKSIEFIPVHQVKVQPSVNCIRCGNCRKICPVHLWPGNLYRIFHLDNFENACESDRNAYKTAVLCSECGLCNSVCPARLPLSQTISLLKESNNV